MGKALHSSIKESLIIVFLSASLLLISSVFALVSAQVSNTTAQASDLDVQFLVKNASDINSENGSINLTISGGVTPYYVYCIQTKKDGVSHNNLKQGVYLFTIIDSAEHKKVVRVEVGINQK